MGTHRAGTALGMSKTRQIKGIQDFLGAVACPPERTYSEHCNATGKIVHGQHADAESNQTAYPAFGSFLRVLQDLVRDGLGQGGIALMANDAFRASMLLLLLHAARMTARQK